MNLVTVRRERHMKEKRRCLASSGGKGILAEQQAVSGNVVDNKVGMPYGGG